MWVVIAVCAVLGLRLFLVLSVLKSDARHWVRIFAYAVIFSTALALISVLERMAGLGITRSIVYFKNDAGLAMIYGVAALDIVGSVFLVLTSSRGWRLAKALLIAAGFVVVAVIVVEIDVFIGTL